MTRCLSLIESILKHIEKYLDVIDYEGKNKGGKIENF